MSLEEPAVEGHHDVGQPAHDGGSHSSGTVEGTAAPTPSLSVPSCWRAWLSRLQAADPVAPDSSATLSPVTSDSSAPLSPGRS